MQVAAPGEALGSSLGIALRLRNEDKDDLSSARICSVLPSPHVVLAGQLLQVRSVQARRARRSRATHWNSHSRAGFGGGNVSTSTYARRLAGSITGGAPRCWARTAMPWSAVACRPSSAGSGSRSASFLCRQPRPNPSFEARPNGIALGPRGALGHHAPRGPSAIPSVPPQLER